MSVSQRYALRTRLLVSLLWTIVFVVLVQAALSYASALQEADALFDGHMKKMAVALRSANPLATYAPNEDVSSDRAGEDFFVQMWNERGQPVFQSAAHRTLRRPAQPGFSDVRTQDRTYRVYVSSTPSQVILIAQDLATRSDLARAMALRSLWPALGVLPLLLGIVWWRVSRAFRPLQLIQQQMAGRRVDDLSPVQETGLPDEVKPIIQELNMLLGRVQQAVQSQTNFVADAAHELRSPLAALKIQCQALQRTSDEPGRERAAQRLDAGIQRLSHLVDQLLDLARHEAALSGNMKPEPLDLSEVSLLALADTLTVAQAHRVDLGVYRAAPCPLRGHAEPLRVLVRNLLDNAVKYTPEGGTVDLHIENLPDLGPTVCVEDSGPGIPEGEMARVTDRFYRVSGARKDGSGLGLAIVKAIADRHGARVLLDRSQRLGGCRVRVVFPSIDPARA